MARLYNRRCIGGKHTSKEDALKGLAKSSRGEVERCYLDLVKRNYILKKPTSYGEQCSLNAQLLKDIIQLLDPMNAAKRDKPPLEESLNAKFEKRPFHSTQGDKTIKGVNARYSYHRGITDLSQIICYVIVDGEKRSSIELGSFNDESSLLVKAIRRMDDVFKGRPFTKPEVYGLGKEIEGNRQPPKAIIDMLLHFGYLIQISPKHYQRTDKKPPVSGLEPFHPPVDPKPPTLTLADSPPVTEQKTETKP
jgi:hypothetical protein